MKLNGNTTNEAPKCANGHDEASSNDASKTNHLQPTKQIKKGLYAAEETATGSATHSYVSYIKACGGWGVAVSVVSLFAIHVASTTFSSWWLSYWLDQGSGRYDPCAGSSSPKGGVSSAGVSNSPSAESNTASTDNLDTLDGIVSTISTSFNNIFYGSTAEMTTAPSTTVPSMVKDAIQMANVSANVLNSSLPCLAGRNNIADNPDLGFYQSVYMGTIAVIIGFSLLRSAVFVKVGTIIIVIYIYRISEVLSLRHQICLK